MITAVDSSVLLDVLTADPEFGHRSRAAIRAAIAEGSLLACEVVVAEVAAFFPVAEDVSTALSSMGVDFDPLTERAAVGAGRAWRAYRERGGRRDRLIADFLVGAHARAQADRLLTRDRGFYRTYFAELQILDPSRA